jgi:hypothetical protein
MDSCVPMSYVIAALGLIVVAQSAALVALAGARQRACRRADEHARRQAEADALAHDFNNLLAVILNYSSFVLGDLGRDDPRRGDVAEISRAAKQGRCAQPCAARPHPRRAGERRGRTPRRPGSPEAGAAEASSGRPSSVRCQPLAAEKRSATFDQSTVFHHASM